MSRRPAARRESRRLALQVLFAAELGHSESVESALERVSEHFDRDPGALPFAKELAVGVQSQREAIDAHLRAHARNWRLERMAAVDRNLLRLAIFELAYTDTPTEVVLDEAVELARAFGSERSPAFVNGVLDGVARELAAAAAGTGPTEPRDDAGEST